MFISHTHFTCFQGGKCGVYWKDGYGPLPVLIMKNTKVNGEYQKETFVQSFTFASGNCIKDYGSKTLHYVGDGQGC